MHVRQIIEANGCAPDGGVGQFLNGSEFPDTADGILLASPAETLLLFVLIVPARLRISTP